MFSNAAFSATPFSVSGGQAFLVGVSDTFAMADTESYITQLQAAIIETMSVVDTESSTLTAIWTVIDTSQTPPDPNWQNIVNP